MTPPRRIAAAGLCVFFLPPQKGGLAERRRAASVAQNWVAIWRPAYAAILRPSASLTRAARPVNRNAKPTTPGFHPRRVVREPLWLVRCPAGGIGPGHTAQPVFVPLAPQAPRPLSQDTDGVQLASSWTRDGWSLMQVRELRISSARNRECWRRGSRCWRRGQ